MRVLSLSVSFMVSLFWLSAANVVALPVFSFKENTSFRVQPSGKNISIPDAGMLLPLAEFDYSGDGVNGWCKYKVLTGRGAPASINVAWIKCNKVGSVVGNM